MINWRTVTQTNDRRFLVKGAELSVALVPGTHSRFQLCEIRCYDKEGFADRRYAVRDAATVTDEQIREGKRSEIVAWHETLDDAVAWCQKQ